MGLVLLTAPAGFRFGDYVWDLLPDPLGWLLILSGVRSLRRAESRTSLDDADLRILALVASIALIASVPPAVPPLFDLILPEDDLNAAALQWGFFLPHGAFLILLAQQIGRAALTQDPPDRYVARRFGVLSWLAWITVALPPVAYTSGDENLVQIALVAIPVTSLAFIYYLFASHRRPWLGGEPVAASR